MSTEQPSNKPTDIDVLNARLGAIKQAFAHLLVVTEQATSAVADLLASLPTHPELSPGLRRMAASALCEMRARLPDDEPIDWPDYLTEDDKLALVKMAFSQDVNTWTGEEAPPASVLLVALAQLVLVGVPTMPSPTPWAMGSATPSAMPSVMPSPMPSTEEPTGAYIDLDGNVVVPWKFASKDEKAGAADLLRMMLRSREKNVFTEDDHVIPEGALRGLLKAIKDGAV